MTDQFLYAFVTLSALVLPIVELPVFISVVSGQSDANVRRAALKVAVGTGLILMAAASGGRILLKWFGVSLPAFRTAGGLVLIVVGMEMLRGIQSSVVTDSAAPSDVQDQLWIPIVMPLIAGPAAITTAITLAIRERAADHLLLPVATNAAIVAVATLVWLVLLMARPLSASLSTRAARLSERFMGLILVAVGCQMALTGVYEFFLGVGGIAR
jgi:multiple antibiotic resistance protein